MYMYIYIYIYREREREREREFKNILSSVVNVSIYYLHQYYKILSSSVLMKIIYRNVYNRRKYIFEFSMFYLYTKLVRL